jgi:hypothetical protein
MSRMPGHPETDERHAAELLADLLSRYGVAPIADSQCAQYGLRRMFHDKWATVSSIAHMLHDAQERQKAQGQQASDLEDERVSG